MTASKAQSTEPNISLSQITFAGAFVGEVPLETSSFKLDVLHKDKRLVCAGLTASPESVQAITHCRKAKCQAIDLWFN